VEPARQQAHLAQIATKAGTDAENLVKEEITASPTKT
jgi:hypothetical protein